MNELTASFSSFAQTISNKLFGEATETASTGKAAAEADKPMSFIDSPFTSKVEYEQCLLLPTAEQKAALDLRLNQAIRQAEHNSTRQTASPSAVRPTRVSSTVAITIPGYVSNPDGDNVYLVETLIANRTLTVQRRFQDFVTLNEVLMQHADASIKLPAFRTPAEGLLPFTKVPRKCERSTQLERYLLGAITACEGTALKNELMDFCMRDAEVTQSRTRGNSAQSTELLSSYQVQTLANVLENGGGDKRQDELEELLEKFSAERQGHRIAWRCGKTI